MLNKRKAAECYYLANIVLTIKVIFASSSLINSDLFDTILSGLYLSLILIKLFSQVYHIKDLVIFGVIGLLAVYTCKENNNYYLMFSCLSCFAIQGIDLKILLKYRCWTKIFLIAFHVLYTFGMMLVDFSAVPTIERNGYIRYFFYLGQPNTFQMYVLWTTLEFMYVYFDKVNERKILGILALNIFFYSFTNSNTAIQVMLFVGVLLYLYKHHYAIARRIINWISQYGYGVFTVMILLLMYMYNYSGGILRVITRVINKGMTGRLAYGAYALYRDGLAIIGHRLSLEEVTLWNGQWFDALYLDSAYMALLLKYGIVWILIAVYGIYQCAKKKKIRENIFLMAYILYGIMESYVLDASICFPILFLGKQYFDQTKKENEIRRGEVK